MPEHVAERERPRVPSRSAATVRDAPPPESGRPSARQLRDALDRCRAAVDLAVALRTRPHRRVGRAHHRLARDETAVDLWEWTNHVAVARHADGDARRRLVERYSRHAEAVARRFLRHREPLEDLRQVALEALLLAIDRFDPERGRPFFAFANPTIVGSLRRHYRDVGWAVRVPRRVHELSTSIREAAEVLGHDLGRPPTDAEIADLLGIDAGEVDEAREALDARAVGSLDTAPGTTTPAPVEALGRIDENLTFAENWAAMGQMVESLSPRDRDLLRWYYLDELTQSEIAERIGASQMHVSRLLARVLRTLRAQLRAD